VADVRPGIHVVDRRRNVELLVHFQTSIHEGTRVRPYFVKLRVLCG
jgi:hypothetical protein